MTIRDKVQFDMTAAMKVRDRKRLDTLRYLLAQIKNQEIETKALLTDEQAIKLLTTEAKRRRESIEAYQKGGRQDLVDKESYQLAVIEEYLPKQLTDEEILAIVSSIKAVNPGADFGTLMRETLKQAAGRADGSRVATLLKSS